MSARDDCKILITKNGPYLVTGNVPLSKAIMEYEESVPVRWADGRAYPELKTYSLCRCGQSESKPYCDGSHTKGFDGTEVASRKTHAEQSHVFKGPKLALKDAMPLCAGARFCERAGGVWELILLPDETSAKIATESACNCPSGRLVISDAKGDIEREYEKQIRLVEDPQEGVSGPLLVQGGMAIESADGKRYEVRNRVTLCRCGKSENKPFCDGTHIIARFRDE